MRNIPVMGHAGEDYFSHAEVALEGCRVPVENRLGAEGSGLRARAGAPRARAASTTACAGSASPSARSTCCARALATRQLRPGQAARLAAGAAARLAESRAEIDASRLLVLDTAERIEAEGGAARVRVSLIKFFVADMLDRVLDRAIQAHGALGLTDDTVLGYMWRHERAARIYDGPDEVHKSVVAREVLKPYGVDVEV